MRCRTEQIIQVNVDGELGVMRKMFVEVVWRSGKKARGGWWDEKVGG